MSACVAGSNAVVTLSLGSRPFVQITRPLMSAYAARIGAAFHIVDKHDHESLQLPAALDKTKTAAQTSRFLKVQVLMYFLKKHARILYLDDDTIVGPATPDLFAAVPCGTLGASVEWHKPPAWHTMHWRSACDIYEMPLRPASCEPKRWRLWNSGVVLLSSAPHLRMLERGWQRDKHRLTCRVLCDQLYLNALFKRENAQMKDIGAAMNYVGSELRRAVLRTTTSNAGSSAGRGGSVREGGNVSAISERRRVGLREACILHLTRKVPKLYVTDWVTQRMLSRQPDVLTCERNGTFERVGAAGAVERRALRSRLPKALAPGKYELGKVLCSGEPQPCGLQPWARGHLRALA